MPELFVAAPSDTGSMIAPHLADVADVGGPTADGPITAARVLLTAAGSPFIRVRFNPATTLACGTRAAQTLRAPKVIITSLRDGAQQTLDALSLAQWNYTSAYFNGSAVQVDLVIWPDASDAQAGPDRTSRLVIDGYDRNDAPLLSVQDLCGSDNRVPIVDNRIGRLSNFCTAWLTSDTNGGLFTAGHCSPAIGSSVSFNVPRSLANGQTVASSPDDQYPIQAISVQGQSIQRGRDWCYFGAVGNSNHGLLPIQRQQASFATAFAPVPSGQTIRISGMGGSVSPSDPTNNFAPTTDTGPYSLLSGTTVFYYADTTGGNSGSPVIDISTNLSIGIHTHAGCAFLGNGGTAMQLIDLQNAIAAPRGVLSTGRGTPGSGGAGPGQTLYVLGDLANNFGTLRTLPQGLGKRAQFGSRWQGLAFNPVSETLFAIDGTNRLYSVTTAGSFASLGIVTGVTGLVDTFSGLAYDAQTSGLYAMAAGRGQLVRIGFETGGPVATPIGPTRAGVYRALEFDGRARVFYTVNMEAASARLVRLDALSGAATIVGPLGNSPQGSIIVNVADLAIAADGTLRGVNGDTGELVSISTTTGGATTLGGTGGLYQPAIGLASTVVRLPCLADVASDSLDATRVPNGSVGPEDLDAFITGFIAANAAIADVANDSLDTTFNPNGSVGPEDLDAFISSFIAGC